MECQEHTLSNLFAQLGQPSDAQAIAQFIERYRALPGAVQLHEAAFWTPAQAAFLREAVQDDADWAEIVEILNSVLYEPH